MREGKRGKALLGDAYGKPKPKPLIEKLQLCDEEEYHQLTCEGSDAFLDSTIECAITTFYRPLNPTDIKVVYEYNTLPSKINSSEQILLEPFQKVVGMSGIFILQYLEKKFESLIPCDLNLFILYYKLDGKIIKDSVVITDKTYFSLCDVEKCILKKESILDLLEKCKSGMTLWEYFYPESTIVNTTKTSSNKKPHVRRKHLRWQAYGRGRKLRKLVTVRESKINH